MVGCDLDANLDCNRAPAGEERQYVLRGDSHGAMIEPPAEAALESSFPGPVCYVAVGGSRIEDHAPARAALGPNVCHFEETGTNNLLNEVWAKTLPRIEETATGLLDVDAQFWFTLNPESARAQGFPLDVRVAWFNQKLREMDDDEVTYPNLELVEWDLVADGHPEWLSSDGLHLNKLGNRFFLGEVTQAAARCPLAPPPPTTTTTSTSTTSPSTTSTSTTSTSTSTTVPETTTTTVPETTTTTEPATMAP
jgi:hypothetical protein